MLPWSALITALLIPFSFKLVYSFQFNVFRPHLTSVLSLSDVPKEVSGLSPCKSYINTKDYERECINEGLGKETLLYADEDILVYNKPENCQTAPGYVSRNSLACNVARDFKLERVDQMIAHRLDHGTSGVVVFARNVNALRSLHEQFRHNWIHKRYVARVHGLLPSLEGEIRLPIQRHIQSRPRVRIHPDGKYAHTEWHVLEVDRCEGKESCIVSLRPFTGRTHQLRIHLASIGHPILGDFFYASEEVYKMSNRLCLHASELSLRHPRTRQGMRFTVKCPF